MILGFLLARAGVDVVVLEKHPDFLRDFRGDTIHPSTLELMHELGLLKEFLTHPHEEVRQLTAQVGGQSVMVGDFSHLPTRCKFAALMPQWDFLNFVAEHAKTYPAFHLRMQADATELITEGDRTIGVRASTPDGPLEILAPLTVGADGRHSTVRARANLEPQNFGSPIDVLWMRVSRQPGDPKYVLGNFIGGKILVMLDRGDYWQCAYVIDKGGFDEVKARGLAQLRDDLAEIVPFLRGRLDELKDWDQIKLLTVVVDRLRQWHRPGLLCIGDAAHAMSPIGGVGINLAIQDAVAAANLLAAPLQHDSLTEADLDKVQRRRMLPTRFIQWLQVMVQDHVISRVLASHKQLKPPWPVRMVKRLPALARIPARLIGVGIRPEHVKTRDVRQPTS
jgi:2-polyprenyl-6-methoxyphenol hydroxylase-like FAD-dependent oxidoreductase